jgi:hydrogenase maturation protease
LRALILGLGNPILSDDAVGLVVARRLLERIGREDVDLIEAATSGLQTVQLLSRYDRAVIIDSTQDKAGLGQACRLEAYELETYPLLSSHGVGLGQAIRLAQQLGMRLPDPLLVYAIAVADPYTFGERLTPDLERRLPSLVQQIASDLTRIWRWS